tara:strand:+ start:117 stop:971 length:855 start_codon:yes stop_codon:yes gene_type:complete
MMSSAGSLGAMYNIKLSALDDTQRYSINRTRLHVAIMNNNLTHFTALLNSSDLQINIVDEEGRTPLHTAAFFGRYDMACALIERGAACNKRDNKGHTPLHDAVNPVFVDLTEQHVQIAELLLFKGAKPSMQAASGFTPLNWMGKFIRHDNMSTARSGYMLMLANLLIAHGAKVDESAYEYEDASESSINISKRGRASDDSQAFIHTPLTWAVSLGLDDIVRMFESRLSVDDNVVLEAATSDLMQLSLLSPKRPRAVSFAAPSSSPSSLTTENDDLGQSVYGAGL